MAGEYRTVLQKTPLGGHAESPDQVAGNSGSPLLQRGLSIRDGIVGAVGYSYGKQIFGSAYTATVDQIGNSRLEEATAIFQKALGYATIVAFAGGVPIAIGAGLAEVGALAITTSVENHAIDLDNDRIRATRGTRINFNAGGYYG